MVAEWIELFPDGETGIPQGSSLSALCANYLLREFDAELNGEGLTMLRYIDDFVILGASESVVRHAWHTGLEFLGELGLEAHEPSPKKTKASKGKVSDGFNFLSYRFRAGQIGLSRDVKRRLLTRRFRSRRDRFTSSQAEQLRLSLTPRSVIIVSRLR